MELHAEFSIRRFESVISTPGPYLLKANQILGGIYQAEGLEAVLDDASLKRWGMEPSVSLPGKVLAVTFDTYKITLPAVKVDGRILSSDDLVVEHIHKIKARVIPYVGPIEDDNVEKPFPVDDTVKYSTRLLTQGVKPVHVRAPHYDFRINLTRGEYEQMMSIPLYETVMRIKTLKLKEILKEI